jgi:hypothetical protein
MNKHNNYKIKVHKKWFFKRNQNPTTNKINTENIKLVIEYWWRHNHCLGSVLMANCSGDQLAWHQTLPHGVHTPAREYRQTNLMMVDLRGKSWESDGVERMVKRPLEVS